jgi:hypothetical protein
MNTLPQVDSLRHLSARGVSPVDVSALDVSALDVSALDVSALDVRRVALPPRTALFVRVGLRPPPASQFVPYLLDDVCRAAEDLDFYIASTGARVLSAPWCRFPAVLDTDRYVVVEHGVDVHPSTATPDDWTLRIVHEPSCDAVIIDAVGSLSQLTARVTQLGARPDHVRWVWHHIDPAGTAHAVTVVCEADRELRQTDEVQHLLVEMQHVALRHD